MSRPEYAEQCDPTQSLVRHLGHLAARWRGCLQGKDVDGQREYVRQYQATYHDLQAIGWKGVLDADAELPDEFMPKEYLEHPRSF